MFLFLNKTLLITGGTGSFGNALLNRFISSDIGEIRIFSRDEEKQDVLRHFIQIRFPQSIKKEAIKDTDIHHDEKCFL